MLILAVILVVDLSKLVKDYDNVRAFKSAHKAACVFADADEHMGADIEGASSELSGRMRDLFVSSHADTVVCQAASKVGDIAAEVGKSMGMSVVRVLPADFSFSRLEQAEQLRLADVLKDADEVARPDDVSEWMSSRAEAAMAVSCGVPGAATDFENKVGLNSYGNVPCEMVDAQALAMRERGGGGVVVAMTGHRPNKLFGYDLSDSRYDALRDRLNAELDDLGATTLITGMALGFDQLACEVALERGMHVVAAVPFVGQEGKWPPASRQHYNELLDKVDEVVVVSEGGYTREAMQKRNEWMVDHADAVVACWDGTPGGTGNCVQYARHQDKEIVSIDPRELVREASAGKDDALVPSPQIGSERKRVVGAVGLTPKSMFGYDMSDARYDAVRVDIEKRLGDLHADVVMVSSEQGYSRLVGEVAQGLGLDVVAVRPYEGFDEKWPKSSKDALAAFESKCVATSTLAGPGYETKKLFDIDRKIIGISDAMLIATDGHSGRPENAIRLCRRENKPFRLADKAVLEVGPKDGPDAGGIDKVHDATSGLNVSRDVSELKTNRSTEAPGQMSFDDLFGD